MLLSVDIGNSRVKWALFEGRECKHSGVSEEEPVYVIKSLFDQYPEISALILSSVRKDLDVDMMPVPETIHHIILDHETEIPLTNLYQSPKTLGRDRLALAVAATALFPGRNNLVIDAGTCLTMDLVTEKGEFIGGTISPGIKLRLKSMADGTGNLPYIDFKGEEAEQIGKNTKDCMLSGAVNGMLNEVSGTISLMQRQFNRLNILITGGDMKIFDSRLKSDIFADPNLVLRGLNEILLYNLNKK